MSNKTWEKWCWKDWFSDTKIQLLSPASRGIWIDILGRLWQEDVYEMTLPISQWALVSRCSETEFSAFLEEGLIVTFCDMSHDVTGNVTLTSRRRKKEDKSRENNRIRKAKSRMSHQCHTKSHTAEREIEREREKKEDTTKTSCPAKKSAFRPPTVIEVEQYCRERKNGIDAEEFIAHYEAGGWMRGKTKIKSWKQCVITWEKNQAKVVPISGRNQRNKHGCVL